MQKTPSKKAPISFNVKSIKIYFSEWNSNFSVPFYNAFQAITDYGACCVMVPFLDFVNNETINIDPSKYTGDHFHSIPHGAKNGVRRGIKLILDVESYNYAYHARASRGLKVALKDARDKAFISQDGFYVAPGKQIFKTDIHKKDIFLFQDLWNTSLETGLESPLSPTPKNLLEVFRQA